MNESRIERRKVSKFNNIWQTILIVIAIASMGFTMNTKLDDAIFTREEVKEIAIEAADQVIYSHKQDVAIIDATDFMQGWIESKDMTMTDYIKHCYENKTRVYKGGLLMINNEYETRNKMQDKYGEHVVNELIDQLIDFRY